tara:strand:+ start:4161 stop:4619 length:459 start_codon:yes stop_codon:yes gene_type:complete
MSSNYELKMFESDWKQYLGTCHLLEIAFSGITNHPLIVNASIKAIKELEYILSEYTEFVDMKDISKKIMRHKKNISTSESYYINDTTKYVNDLLFEATSTTERASAFEIGILNINFVDGFKSEYCNFANNQLELYKANFTDYIKQNTTKDTQ